MKPACNIKLIHVCKRTTLINVFLLLSTLSLSAQTKLVINDFTPGNNVIFSDDFSKDNTGDFPAKWNTNGSGEVVVLAEKDNKKYFMLKGGAVYVPVINKPLPDDYTIEFDLITKNLTKKVSSTANLKISIDDNNQFKGGKNRASLALHFAQYIPIGVRIQKYANGKAEMKNEIREDYRNRIAGESRISIAVNKNRLRLWLNESKLVDIPTLVPEGSHYLKLELSGFTEDHKIMQTYIGDMKVSAAGPDTRSLLIKQLLDEGKAVTNDILFDVNSDVIKKESYSIINQFGEALKNNPGVKIKIIGHTDNDGKAEQNLALSKRRAASVKNYIVIKYEIDESRMMTDGKGAGQPVSDNKTNDGKAKNRRVEFVKL